MHCFHGLLAASSPASCKMAAPAEGGSRACGREGGAGGKWVPSLLLGKVEREAEMEEGRGERGGGWEDDGEAGACLREEGGLEWGGEGGRGDGWEPATQGDGTREAGEPAGWGRRGEVEEVRAEGERGAEGRAGGQERWQSGGMGEGRKGGRKRGRERL